jgi:hypothetical protein
VTVDEIQPVGDMAILVVEVRMDALDLQAPASLTARPFDDAMVVHPARRGHEGGPMCGPSGGRKSQPFTLA